MNKEWFILLLTTVATYEVCQAIDAGTELQAKNCQNYGKRRPALDAPVYSSGTENLSTEKCGLWNGDGDMPWTVIISIENANWHGPFFWIPDDLTCRESYGFLITERAVLVFRNKTIARNIKYYRLYAGPCESGSNEGNCKFGRGLLNQKVQNIYDDRYSKLAVWKIEKVTLTQHLKPICLWNRNNLQDSSFDSYVFTQADRKLKNTTLLNHQECYRESNISKFICQKMNVRMCTHFEDSGMFLIMKDSNRYYFRATRYNINVNFEWDDFWHGDLEKKIILWSDIFDILNLNENVFELAGVTVMPPIPELANKIEFGAKESYEGCGKVAWTRRGGRQRRDGLPIPLLHHGTNAPIEENPWHVSLTINFPTTEPLFDICGGTLVSKRVIVTAAHCMFSPTTGTRYEMEWLEITLGMYDVGDNTENGRQIVQAASVVIHPKYNNDRKDFQHDLALIILDEHGNNSIHLSDRVRPACLWNSDYDIEKIAGQDGKVVGFGLTANYSQATILQKAFIRIESHNECFFSNKRFFSKHLRPTQNFCAGFPHNGTNVCVGDSGGGLIIANGTLVRNKRFYLRGVVSFGSSRIKKIDNVDQRVCDTNQFSLFVDITRYIEWIVQNSPDISLRR
ncbi:uncharacterized protein LOC135936674 isoform X6 [Cloeon dipterum]|uniref:uncharacterized protein LOC135936674 isoform X6 n=1 Tax=Cloeon dipterum TaxID=197152 RepID=UPI0032208592